MIMHFEHVYVIRSTGMQTHQTTGDTLISQVATEHGYYS